MFNRRPTHQPATSHTPDLDDINTTAVIAEEFTSADRSAAPTLQKLCRQRTPLTRVTHDPDRGTAVLEFTDTTRVTIASNSDQLPQLEAATRLAPTVLTHTWPYPDRTGRLMVFTAVHWTIWLPITIAHV